MLLFNFNESENYFYWYLDQPIVINFKVKKLCRTCNAGLGEPNCVECVYSTAAVQFSCVQFFISGHHS